MTKAEEDSIVIKKWLIGEAFKGHFGEEDTHYKYYILHVEQKLSYFPFLDEYIINEVKRKRDISFSCYVYPEGRLDLNIYTRSGTHNCMFHF